MKISYRAALASSSLLLLFIPTFVVAQTPAAPQSMLRDRTAARELYQARCTSCHDHPTDRIPPKEALIARGPDAIVRALTQGPMQPMANGLSRAEIEGLAVVLTGKAPLP